MEKKYYNVYHNNMRGAKIYNKNSENEKIEYENESAWISLRQDPLIDTVPAFNENEAVKIVARENGFHKSNLYAKECIIKSDMQKKHKHKEKVIGTFTASAFESETKSGIDIELPNGEHSIVFYDNKDGKIKLFLEKQNKTICIGVLS